MSRYLEIRSVQAPFQFSVDTSGRTLYSTNYEALLAAPSAAFQSELAKLILDASLATALGTDVFLTPSQTLPTGDGPYIQIFSTGGREPEEAHGGEKYERLSAQVIVTAKDPAAGLTRASAIWRLLDGQRNVTVAA